MTQREGGNVQQVKGAWVIQSKEPSYGRNNEKVGDPAPASYNSEAKRTQPVIVEHGVEFIWQLCPVCEVRVGLIKDKQVCPQCHRIITACCD